MNTILAVLVCLAASLFFTSRLAISEMRRFALIFHTLAFISLLPVIGLINDWLPFSGAGDDSNYFWLASVASSWSDVIDSQLFSRYMAQPGFVMLLNAFNLVFAPSLFGFKVLNLTFFLLLVQVWSRIVAEIEGVKFARRFLMCCVALTPMWFYFFFLLKDMLIALTLAIFLLGVVFAWKTPSRLLAWGLQLLAVIAVIPLRAPLVAQMLVVTIAVTIGRVTAGGPSKHRTVVLLFGATFAAVAVSIASNPAFFDALGVTSESRTLDDGAMIERANLMMRESMMRRTLFPLLYLFSETSAFSMTSWQVLNAAWLRGMLALPWIFLGVPLFILGVIGLIRTQVPSDVAAPRRYGFLQSRMFATPWLAVVVFIAVSAAISWVVGDTTRWRIADMPALLAVAVSATKTSRAGRVFAVTATWALCISALFAMFLFIKSN